MTIKSYLITTVTDTHHSFSTLQSVCIIITFTQSAQAADTLLILVRGGGGVVVVGGGGGARSTSHNKNKSETKMTGSVRHLVTTSCQRQNDPAFRWTAPL